MKRCLQCQKVLSSSAFYVDERTPDGLRGTCKDCRRIQNSERVKRDPRKEANYQRNYRESNREKRRVQNQEWAARNPERRRDLRLRWNYGLTEKQFLAKKAAQADKCAICQKVPRAVLQVDHCHATRKFRGLLCRQCNLALGGFQDSTKILRGAICYLASHRRKQQTNRKKNNE